MQIGCGDAQMLQGIRTMIATGRLVGFLRLFRWLIWDSRRYVDDCVRCDCFVGEFRFVGYGSCVARFGLFRCILFAGFVCHLFFTAVRQGGHDFEASAELRASLQRASGRFDAFFHAQQAVTWRMPVDIGCRAMTIVGDGQSEQTVVP